MPANDDLASIRRPMRKTSPSLARRVNDQPAPEIENTSHFKRAFFVKLDPDASAIPNGTAMCSHEYRQVNRARTLYFPPKIRLRDRHGTPMNGLGEKTHRSDCANVSMTLWFPKIRRNQLERTGNASSGRSACQHSD
ncbi:MAG: hypothetical protein E5Y02_31630 [Mesorhizobium sp.]|nr:MAG: hypothetical protein E5Y02_31630 [Mesorhizobium sp.]